MKIPLDLIPTAYDISKKVYNASITRSEGIKLLSDGGRMNESSANDYFYDFRYLMQGKMFTRTLNADSMDYFLENILKEYGASQLNKSLAALTLHIEYYEKKQKTTMHQMRAIHDKYSKKTRDINSNPEIIVNAANITREEYIVALKVKGVLNERNKKVLEAFYETAQCKATPKQIAEKLNIDASTINLIFGRLGKLVSQQLNIKPEKRKAGTYKWYTIIAEGNREPNGFNWSLNKNFIDALIELGIFSAKTFFPEEVNPNQPDLLEGSIRKIYVNAYERNSFARKKCIEHYGPKCQVCEMDFQSVYDGLGNDYIHVHHLELISRKDGIEYKVDPVKDLVPVCPNCHAMLHQKNPPFKIDELRGKLKMYYR